MSQEWKYNPKNDILIHWHGKINLSCIDSQNNIYFLSKSRIYKCNHEDKHCVQMILEIQDSKQIFSMEILQDKYLYFVKQGGTVYKLDLESKLIYEQKYLSWWEDYDYYKLIKIPSKNDYLLMIIDNLVALVKFSINNKIIVNRLKFKLEGYYETGNMNEINAVTCTPNDNVYIIYTRDYYDAFIYKFNLTGLFDYMNNEEIFKGDVKLEYCCKVGSNIETDIIQINKSETIMYKITDDNGISKINLDNLDLKSFEIPRTREKNYNKEALPKYPNQKLYKVQLEYQYDNIRDFLIDSDDNLIMINCDNYIYRRTKNKPLNSVLLCKNDFAKKYLSLGFLNYEILSTRLRDLSFFKINFF